MTGAFGVAGTCLLAALAVGAGVVGLVVWTWFGGEDDDDDDDWESWLSDQDEEDEDGDR